MKTEENKIHSISTICFLPVVNHFSNNWSPRSGKIEMPPGISEGLYRCLHFLLQNTCHLFSHMEMRNTVGNSSAVQF